MCLLTQRKVFVEMLCSLKSRRIAHSKTSQHTAAKHLLPSRQARMSPHPPILSVQASLRSANPAQPNACSNHTTRSGAQLAFMPRPHPQLEPMKRTQNPICCCCLIEQWCSSDSVCFAKPPITAAAIVATYRANEVIVTARFPLPGSTRRCSQGLRTNMDKSAGLLLRPALGPSSTDGVSGGWAYCARRRLALA